MANKTFLNGVENALRQSVEVLQKTERISALSDLFVEVNTDSGAVSMYDDNEELLHKEWIDGLEGTELEGALMETLRRFFAKDSTRELIETLNLLKPFSVVLVDGQQNPLEELLLIDDETLLLNNDLLEKYDRELNDFLKTLLEN